MNNVTLTNIPGAEDKDKAIMVNGVPFGTVMRGWLNTGGNQWVAYIPGNFFGATTLQEVKREVARRFDKATVQSDSGKVER